MPFSFRNLSRSAFLGVAITALVVNFAFDIFIFKGNREANRKDESVASEYRELILCERLLISLTNQRTTLNEEDPAELIKKIGPLTDSDHERDLLREIESNLSTNPKRARELAVQLTREQTDEVRAADNDDMSTTQSLEGQMQLTLFMDFVVIAALMFLFHVNLSEKLRIERNLKKTLNTLRETLLSLEEEIFRRKAIVKTTVHDLKNPLGSILGFAELLGERSNNVIETSDFIQRISRRTLALVDSMVHAEEAHAYDLEKLDPHELVRNVCSELEVLAHAKGQKIVVFTDSPQTRISANKLKIEELVSNLVSNAIKYSPPKTKITVYSRVEGAEFRFAVEDQGPGFTEEDRARAFQYGVTLAAKPTKGESSSGFGLFISKQIVTSHKGHIEIDRAPAGSGARVSFGLPLN